MKKFKRILVIGTATTMLLGSVLNVSAAGLHDIFDAKYYADSYADLKEAFGYDENLLYQHFLTYGLKEGRNMSPILNVVAYREGYSDLNAAFGDNWDAYVDHFFTFGAREMRDKGVLFNPVVYADAYGDIKAVYGDNLASIAEHYLVFGRAEHRTLGTSGGYADIAAAKIAEWKEQQTSASQPIIPTGPSSLWYHNGHVEYRYDDQGNRITEIYYNEIGNILLSYHHTYNSNGDIVYSETSYREGILDSYSEYVYDGKKLQKETHYNSNGTVTSSSIYEWTGNKVKILDYDESGNLAGYKECETDDNFNFTKEVNYDSSGILLRSYKSTYDKDGNLLTGFSYDADGKIIGNTVYTYYANGIAKTCVNIQDNKTEEYEFNESGNELSYKIYSDGKLVDTYTNEFYPEGSLKKTYLEHYSNDEISSNTSFYYDKQGRQLKTIENSATGALATTVIEYAADGGFTVSYESYNPEGILTGKAIAIRNAQNERIKHTAYTLADDGSTKSIIVIEYENNKTVKRIIYDADGKPHIKEFYNDIGETIAVFEYDENGNEIALRNENGVWVRPSETSNTNELKSMISIGDSVSVTISNDAAPSGSVSDGNAVTGSVSDGNAVSDNASGINATDN